MYVVTLIVQENPTENLKLSGEYSINSVYWIFLQQIYLLI